MARAIADTTLMLSCSLLVVLALVMVFTDDYPDKIMGKIFMGIACMGGFLIAGEMLCRTTAYDLPMPVVATIFGLSADKARSLMRFFKHRKRIRLDEVTPALYDPKPAQDATMFIRKQS